MSPGTTRRPRASSTSSPGAGLSPAPTAAMRPPANRTSRTSSRPSAGSMTRPPRINMFLTTSSKGQPPDHLSGRWRGGRPTLGPIGPPSRRRPLTRQREDRLHVLAVLLLELRPDLLPGYRDERRLVHLVDGHALLTELLEIVRVVVAGELALRPRDFQERRLEPILRVGREPIPPLLARERRRRPEQVLRQGEILLDLVELVAQDDLGGVLLAVEHAGLERRVHLREVHGRGLGAEGLKRLQVSLLGRHADLQALEVVGSLDRALAVGEVPPGAPPPGLGEGLESLAGQLALQLGVGGTVEILLRLFVGREEVGDVEQAHPRRDVGDLADDRHLDGPDPQPLEERLVAAELTGGIELVVDGSGQPPGQRFAEALPAPVHAVLVARLVGGDLEDDLRGVGPSRHDGSGARGGERREQMTPADSNARLRHEGLLARRFTRHCTRRRRPPVSTTDSPVGVT